MNKEFVYRLGLAAVSLGLAVARMFYGGLAIRSGGKVAFKRAGRLATVLIWSVGITAMFASSIYIFLPQWMAWAALPQAMGWRWLGIGTSLLTVMLFRGCIAPSARTGQCPAKSRKSTL